MLYDKDIREGLFDFMDELYPINRVIEEKQTGKARADAVLVTPENIYGIEIKSDADTYTRLAKQVKYYNLYYDYNYVVVGTTHATHIAEHVSDWWGIVTVDEIDGKPDFYLLRKPQKNPKMKWKRKLSMLWRPELAHIQEINKMFAYKQKSKDFVIEKILKKVPEEMLQQQICNELMERDYTTISDVIAEYRKSNTKTKKTAKRKK